MNLTDKTIKIELPFNVGDRVYVIHENRLKQGKLIDVSINIRSEYVSKLGREAPQAFIAYAVSLDGMNSSTTVSRVFPSKEAALAALAEDVA